MRTILSQISWMKCPVLLLRIGRPLPPPLFNDYIIISIPIDVPITQSVRVFMGTNGGIIANHEFLPFGVPFFNRSFEPEHLLGHRIVKDEIQSSISIDIRTNRGFISGILMDHVLAPVSRFAFRILIPDRFLPRLV